ncbi:MAG: (2Fe-2S)-binding protein [Pseudomonadota bacterium]
MKNNFILNINGAEKKILCEPERTLLDCIREDLRLTGTKCGCGIGACGTCTVLVDGKAALACRVKIKNVSSPESQVSVLPKITTIEGLEHDGKLHPIQQAFIDCGAIQCGFCTPGMVLRAKALLDETPSPTRVEIRKALAGNLCRCTGYQQIFEAIEEAAKKMRAIP